MSTQFYLSAAHKSSGKTLLGVGLSAGLVAKKYQVQTFKKGLDYIDPIWLSLASDNPCYNLDFYTSTHQEIRDTFAKYSQDKDISIIEGNKGLYDGMTTDGGDSNADMAELLGLPIILVIDCTGITRGIAPLLQGYQQFENSNITGVILNKVAGSRHEGKLRTAVQTYTDLSIFGAVGRDETLFVEERYLGLKPANEDNQALTHIQTLALRVSQEVDLDNLIKQNQCDVRGSTAYTKSNSNVRGSMAYTQITLAVAKDKAFGFYYADDMEVFEHLGVKIIYFDTMKDKYLPQTDALFIGGGFPEVYAKQLSNNQSLLKDIKQKIVDGLPAYAECGGLMYLTKGIQTIEGFFDMVGIIPAKTKIHNKPIGRGYVQLEPNQNHLWQSKISIIYAHEFHYSSLFDLDDGLQYAYTMRRGVGVNGQDGIMRHNLLACYSHLHQTQSNEWINQFVNFIKSKQ